MHTYCLSLVESKVYVLDAISNIHLLVIITIFYQRLELSYYAIIFYLTETKTENKDLKKRELKLIIIS